MLSLGQSPISAFTEEYRSVKNDVNVYNPDDSIWDVPYDIDIFNTNSFPSSLSLNSDYSFITSSSTESSYFEISAVDDVASLPSTSMTNSTSNNVTTSGCRHTNDTYRLSHAPSECGCGLLVNSLVRKGSKPVNEICSRRLYFDQSLLHQRFRHPPPVNSVSFLDQLERFDPNAPLDEYSFLTLSEEDSRLDNSDMHHQQQEPLYNHTNALALPSSYVDEERRYDLFNEDEEGDSLNVESVLPFNRENFYNAAGNSDTSVPMDASASVVQVDAPGFTVFDSDVPMLHITTSSEVDFTFTQCDESMNEPFNPDFLRFLNTFELNSESLQSGGTCPICLEDFVVAIKIVEFDCKHEFHIRCAEEWLRRGNRTCPCCRQIVFYPVAS
ncbi:hypothetical protein AB6A40_001338 [Gnathostoma spinigerum]|uniref:RING-type domain-containing protein n=1 Tax=Gnathostoma spinigerum TaxID=75299 RepID=A0ABD6EBA4_9BILA